MSKKQYDSIHVGGADKKGQRRIVVDGNVIGSVIHMPAKGGFNPYWRGSFTVPGRGGYWRVAEGTINEVMARVARALAS